MSDLTNDEFTCLMIAAQGEYMLAIGRWEQSIKALTARGLMRQWDQVNYVITDEGRKAAKQRDHQDEVMLTEAFSRRASADHVRRQQAVPNVTLATELCQTADRIEGFIDPKIVTLLRRAAEALCHTQSP